MTRLMGAMLLVGWLSFGCCQGVRAQEVEFGKGEYYRRDINMQQRAMPLPYVRESDVVWEHWVWRVIDFKERSNQFFYYPVEESGVHGRKNLAFVLWGGIVRDEITVYEDDEFKVPVDNARLVHYYTKADTVTLEIIDDEDEYEYKTVLVPREFTTEEIFRLRLKEAWYIDKQATEQYVRIVGMAPVQEMYKERDGEREYRGAVTLFWVPMLSPSVRTLLVQHEAYVEDNIAQLPSWGHIFESRMFSSFITRETNRFNRTIESYLTGVDAILESERIEDKLLNISQDMWEY